MDAREAYTQLYWHAYGNNEIWDAFIYGITRFQLTTKGVK